MAANRLLRMSKPLGHAFSQQIFSKSAFLSKGSRPRTQMCLSKVGLNSVDPPGGGERKPAVVKAVGCTSACVLVSEPKIDKRDRQDLLSPSVADGISHWLKFMTQKRTWKLNLEMIIEKIVIDCRFFTMLATAGSLAGSFLCFVERLPSWIGMESVIQAKSKIGHAVNMILQVEVLEKFKSAPLVTGLDLACFVGTVFLSSAAMYVLSRIAVSHAR